MMLSRLQWALLMLAGIFALTVLTPIGVAANWLGVSARSSQGVVAIGTLRDATWGRTAFGDINLQLQPTQLFLGRLAFGLSRGEVTGNPGVSGSAGQGLGGVYVEGLTATLDGRAVSDDLEGSDLRLEGLSFQFSGGRCTSASGVVRLDLSRTPFADAIKGGLIGNANCSKGDLLLPLLSQSTMEKLVLRLKGDRSYQATLTIMEPAPETANYLQLAGFRPIAGGYRLVRSGKLR